MSAGQSPRPLPEPVRALAHRLGASDTLASRTVTLRQTGHLRTESDAKWMAFAARQWISHASPEFCWRCQTGPLRLIHVEDSLIDDSPAGVVRIAGVLPIQRAAESPELLKGQLMRYLAELPWAPDAILTNSALHWASESVSTLSVAASIGGVKGSVTFTIGDDGLPLRVEGLRPRKEQSGFCERAWSGAFSNYRRRDGRMIPHQASVGWTVADTYSEVWRGELTEWALSDTRF